MPATLTSAGTWTSLPFDAAMAAKTGPNERRVEELNLSQLATFDHAETLQMVQLVADGYSIGFQQAALLLRHLLTALLQRNAPQVERSYSP